MYCIESYKDLTSEIEMAKARIEGLEKQRELLTKLLFKGPKGYTPIDMSGMPKGSRNDISLDRLVEAVSKIDNMLYIEGELLKGMEETIKKIKGKLEGLEGNKYKVAYKRIIENKAYKEIANELHLSEDYVKHIGAELNKR